MVHILVCDDDPLFAKSMSEKIKNLPTYAPKAIDLKCFCDVESIEGAFSNCDILFLDIDLGAKNGIDLARELRRYNPDCVLIFVTNFKEFAPEGYEVNAFRYLSKSDIDKKLASYFTDALDVCRRRQRKVEIMCEGESIPIQVQSLVYIESQGREQRLHLCGGPRDHLFTRTTMSQLEELLSSQGFLRIHKGFLVNMYYLQTLQSTGAKLTTGEQLPVGARSYRANKQKFITWQAQQIW